MFRVKDIEILKVSDGHARQPVLTAIKGLGELVKARRASIRLVQIDGRHEWLARCGADIGADISQVVHVGDGAVIDSGLPATRLSTLVPQVNVPAASGLKLGICGLCLQAALVKYFVAVDVAGIDLVSSS